MQQIKIKAFFGDWHEADFQTALKLFKHLLRMHIPGNFIRHFKGVTYEELAAGRQRND